MGRLVFKSFNGVLFHMNWIVIYSIVIYPGPQFQNQFEQFVCYLIQFSGSPSQSVLHLKKVQQYFYTKFTLYHYAFSVFVYIPKPFPGQPSSDHIEPITVAAVVEASDKIV